MGVRDETLASGMPKARPFGLPPQDSQGLARGAFRLNGSAGPGPVPRLQALVSCLFGVLVMGFFLVVCGGIVYLIGMFTLQAMHPETGPPHRLACPCHRLRLGHVMNSLCVRADRMYSFSERPMTWTVWAQASFGREKPDMSAEDDVHSSDIEEEAAAAGGRGRTTRIWEVPRGPPLPVSVNEPAAVKEQRASERRVAQAISQRVSAAVTESLMPVTQEIHAALTDIDEDALEDGQVAVHIQRLPEHGLQHPWTLWSEAPADAEGRTQPAMTPPPGLPDRALSLIGSRGQSTRCSARGAS